MKQTRRGFLQWLLGLFPLLTGFFGQFRARGATTAETPIATSQSELTFLIFGDWGRGGEFHQRDVASQMGLAAAKRRREPFLPRYTRLYGRDLDGQRDAR
jgi:hypothetical protein